VCALTPAGWPAEFIFKRHYNCTTKTEERRENLFSRRTIPAKSFVHKAALARGPEYLRLLPADAEFVD
jgi:hypothetical protein